MSDTMERLRTETVDMQALIARADTKAQGMAGVYSLLLTAAAFARGQVDQGAMPVLATAAVLVGGALGLALLVILPRLGRNPGTGLIAWTRYSAARIVETVERDEDSETAARQLRKLARIATAKFRLIQSGVVLVLLALLLVAIAAVITAVA
ncbi:DUF5706 domain-containing protein [Saccharopolyspora sp. 6T]|uniref:Pycsar system effector family protein n=1 Tax=Saccharopolyspora sp. 6T TaxID=2877238 RepID=UPI001CD31B03|nr:Pycsar system effector family protein [Saccharopolyspora sp. 6T]MCA1185755.1 DUF5706 domain-containing protein [Saccharopolyspora sp. 6T]